MFTTLPIKLKLGLQIGERLLTTTHLDQSNYITNRKEQGAVEKYNLTLFIRDYVPKSLTQPLARDKNGDQQFWKNKNFMQPMGRLSMQLMMGPGFFLIFPLFRMCGPRVFPLAPRFNPICFAQSPPLLTYFGGPKGEPKGEVLQLLIKSSILGSFHSSNFFPFFLLWANQNNSLQQKKKKKELDLCNTPN